VFCLGLMRNPFAPRSGGVVAGAPRPPANFCDPYRGQDDVVRALSFRGQDDVVRALSFRGQDDVVRALSFRGQDDVVRALSLRGQDDVVRALFLRGQNDLLHALSLRGQEIAFTLSRASNFRAFGRLNRPGSGG
jgi:hypothetical protein